MADEDDSVNRPPWTGAWEPLGQGIFVEEVFDTYGWSVALSANGNILGASRPGGSSPVCHSWASHVRVFQYNQTNNGAAWTPLGQTIHGMGIPLVMSADGFRLATTLDQEDEQSPRQEQAMDYDDAAREWKPLGQVLRGEEPMDEFGFSLDLSDDGLVVAVEAPFHGSWSRSRTYVSVQ